MRRLKYWQKWGVIVATSQLLLTILFTILDEMGWWYQDTIWYPVLVTLSYPASIMHNTFMAALSIKPRMSGVAIPWHEIFVINVSGIAIWFAWWFLIGTVLAIVVRRFRKLCWAKSSPQGRTPKES